VTRLSEYQAGNFCRLSWCSAPGLDFFRRLNTSLMENWLADFHVASLDTFTFLQHILTPTFLNLLVIASTLDMGGRTGASLRSSARMGTTEPGGTAPPL